MAVNTYPLNSSIQQTEQINGYYLLSFSLESGPSIEQFLNCRCHLGSFPNIKITLFQMPNSGTKSYRFLSRQPLPEAILNNDRKISLIVESNQSKPFTLPENDRPLFVLAEADFIANAFALGKLREQQKSAATILFMEADAFPFMPKPARFWAAEMPDEAIGASALLEDWGMMNRMASSNLIAGCYHGSLLELFKEWKSKTANLEAWQLTVLAEEKQQNRYIQAWHSS